MNRGVRLRPVLLALGLGFAGCPGQPAKKDVRAELQLDWPAGCNGKELANCLERAVQFGKKGDAVRALVHGLAVYVNASNAGKWSASDRARTHVFRVLNDGRLKLDKAAVGRALDRGCERSAEGCLAAAEFHKSVQEHRRSAELARRACEKGSVQGCVEIGWRYLQGPGIEVDCQRSRATFRAACDRGNSEGCVGLGVQLMRGCGLESNGSKAEALLTPACEAGHLTACVWLGIRLQDRFDHEAGWVTKHKRDVRRALGLFQKACTAGNPFGCGRLGELHRAAARGGTVECNGRRESTFPEEFTPDPKHGLALLKQACQDGSSQACVALAAAVSPKNEPAELRLYRRAMEMGSPAPCTALGFFHSTTLEEKMRSLRMGCEGGWFYCCLLYADRLRQSGRMDLVLQVVERGCRQGSSGCCAEAGKELFAKRPGGEEALFQRACELSAAVCEEIGKFYEEQADPAAKAKARYYFKEAVSRLEPLCQKHDEPYRACYVLAKLYAEGKGTAQNYDRAIELNRRDCKISCFEDTCKEWRRLARVKQHKQ